MRDRVILPIKTIDWAMACPTTHTFEEDVDDPGPQLRRFKRRTSDEQAMLDTLLLKVAQTEDCPAEEFLRIARQKQKEGEVLQRATQIEAGEQQDNADVAKILELAQRLPQQYLTFTPPQDAKWSIQCF